MCLYRELALHVVEIERDVCRRDRSREGRCRFRSDTGNDDAQLAAKTDRLRKNADDTKRCPDHLQDLRMDSSAVLRSSRQAAEVATGIICPGRPDDAGQQQERCPARPDIFDNFIPFIYVLRHLKIGFLRNGRGLGK